MSEATTSAVKQEIRIRAMEEAQEMGVCVDLQQRIWGYAPLDTVPDQIFIVARKTGGQVMTAFDGATPVGFALAFAAMREGLTYLHSHMVGVVEEYQNRGVGRLLKLAQREDALIQIVLCHHGRGPHRRHERRFVHDFPGALDQVSQCRKRAGRQG